uniref:Uncharacterized protein n=1 Tax=Glossina brevipalpis TaxID=37001 RepID=A0A1A9W3A2_9MUSC
MALKPSALKACSTTRLPLEVYELTPSGIAGVTELKHKTLEYSTVDSDTLRSSTAIHVQHLATKGPQNTSQKHTIHSNKDDTKDSLIQLQLDRRRSRQMLDIMKQQQQQQQQQQQKQHHVEASSHKLHTSLRHLKDVRILYQVGVEQKCYKA